MEVLILRDPRESVKKCSLTPLRGMDGVRFIDWKRDRTYEVGARLYLHPDGDELTAADRDLGLDLLLIDCSWRRVRQLLGSVEGELVPRRLPPLQTAYPRVSRVFEDPDGGLASIEALYAAAAIMGLEKPEWLEAYRWKDEFLERNPQLTQG